MRAKVLVRVDRQAALNAIHVLDSLSIALGEKHSLLPKKLRRKYVEARQELAAAIGYWAFCNGVAELSE
jgi:hypothetical protein